MSREQTDKWSILTTLNGAWTGVSSSADGEAVENTWTISNRGRAEITGNVTYSWSSGEKDGPNAISGTIADDTVTVYGNQVLKKGARFWCSVKWTLRAATKNELSGTWEFFDRQRGTINGCSAPTATIGGTIVLKR